MESDADRTPDGAEVTEEGVLIFVGRKESVFLDWCAVVSAGVDTVVT